MRDSSYILVSFKLLFGFFKTVLLHNFLKRQSHCRESCTYFIRNFAKNSMVVMFLHKTSWFMNDGPFKMNPPYNFSQHSIFSCCIPYFIFTALYFFPQHSILFLQHSIFFYSTLFYFYSTLCFCPALYFIFAAFNFFVQHSLFFFPHFL